MYSRCCMAVLSRRQIPAVQQQQRQQHISATELLKCLNTSRIQPPIQPPQSVDREVQAAAPKESPSPYFTWFKSQARLPPRPPSTLHTHTHTYTRDTTFCLLHINCCGFVFVFGTSFLVYLTSKSDKSDNQTWKSDPVACLRCLARPRG